MSLEADAVRAHFEARSRVRADELRTHAPNRGAPWEYQLQCEFDRDREQRDRFIDSPAFARILAVLPAGEKGLAKAARIIGRLCWAQDHRPLMRSTDPAEALASEAAMEDGRAGALDTLRDLIVKLGPNYQDRLGAIHDQVQRDPWPTRAGHLWSRGFDAQHLGARGGATDRAGAWRGLIVSELAALMPDDVRDSNAAIAELLRQAGDKTIESHHVRGILSSRRRRRGRTSRPL